MRINEVISIKKLRPIQEQVEPNEEILLESFNVDVIFSPLLNFLEMIPKGMIQSSHYSDSIYGTKKEIRTFPRTDIKLWFALLIRASTITKIINTLFQHSNTDEYKRLETTDVYRKNVEIMNQYMQRSGTSQDVLLGVHYNQVVTDFKHYLSLGIPEILEYRFEPYDHVNHLYQKFRLLEDMWRRELSEVIVYDGEPIVLDFPDEYAWYDLQTASCRAEGDAMGHCGNLATPGPNDTIYSLRKTVREIGGKKYLRPVCTFIFNKATGTFGEMKGRANEKPQPKYHKYIEPLIMQPFVKGLEGGGYLPDSNFSVMDLPNWRSLVQQKPTLLTLPEYIEEFGVDDSVKERLKEATFTSESWAGVDYDPNSGEITLTFDKDRLDESWTNPPPAIQMYLLGELDEYFISGEPYVRFDDLGDTIYNTFTMRQEDELIGFFKQRFPEYEDHDLSDSRDVMELLKEEREEIYDEIYSVVENIFEDGFMQAIVDDIESFLSTGPNEIVVNFDDTQISNNDVAVINYDFLDPDVTITIDFLNAVPFLYEQGLDLAEINHPSGGRFLVQVNEMYWDSFEVDTSNIDPKVDPSGLLLEIFDVLKSFSIPTV